MGCASPIRTGALRLMRPADCQLSHRAMDTGVACGIRTRVPELKVRSPRPTRRTRHATGALGDESNARPAAYKVAALPAELRGLEIHFGCAHARGLPSLGRQRGVSLHEDRRRSGNRPGTSRAAYTRVEIATPECMDTPEVERMTSFELVASTMAWSRSAC